MKHRSLEDLFKAVAEASMLTPHEDCDVVHREAKQVLKISLQKHLTNRILFGILYLRDTTSQAEPGAI